MRIGNLRRTVTIQRQSKVQDVMGQPVDTWTTLVTRRASLEPLNGREYLEASGENADVSTRIRIRYDATVARVKPYDKIIDGASSPNAVYDIESVIVPRERNREIVLMCRRL